MRTCHCLLQFLRRQNNEDQDRALMWFFTKEFVKTINYLAKKEKKNTLQRCSLDWFSFAHFSSSIVT